jgi:uncharacterized protein
MSEQIHIEVIYALQVRQRVVPLSLPAGATLREAVERSGLMAEFPEIDLDKNKYLEQAGQA